MVTKAKTETAPKSAQGASQSAAHPLADALSAALKLVDSGKHAEAAKALQALMVEAQAAGEWSVKRRAQIYLSLADSKVHPAKAEPSDPITEIQACLNRRDTDEAIKLSEKALKTHPTLGSLHYLRAIAFAQADNTDACAESLKKAVELDGDFLFQWFMEPDFNPFRKSPLFAFTEGR